MDARALRTHLWWTLVLVLTALGGAGLAVAADRQANPVQRPELTWHADAVAQPWIDALAADLEAVRARASALSTAGRDVLGQVQALDLPAANAALAAGDEASAALETLIAAAADRSAQADAALQRWRLGPQAAGLLDRLDLAISAAQELPTDWAGLAADARPVVALVDALGRHSALAFQATSAGRDARWADALDLLSQADAALAEASAQRDLVAKVASVETLDDLLSRNGAYDTALAAMYIYLRGGGAQSGATFRALQIAIDQAQAALPDDNGVLAVIVGEAAGTPIADALVAMEEVHGTINDALQAVTDARNGGPPPDGVVPDETPAP